MYNNTDNSDENNALREQLEAQRSDLRRLQGEKRCCLSLLPLPLPPSLSPTTNPLLNKTATVGHFRAWAAQLQARYTLFSPDAARPAKRVYIGNLPTDTTEQDLRQFINDVMVRSGGCSQTGFPVLSCKFYLVRCMYYCYCVFLSILPLTPSLSLLLSPPLSLSYSVTNSFIFPSFLLLKIYRVVEVAVVVQVKQHPHHPPNQQTNKTQKRATPSSNSAQSKNPATAWPLTASNLAIASSKSAAPIITTSTSPSCWAPLNLHPAWISPVWRLSAQSLPTPPTSSLLVASLVTGQRTR